MKRLRRLWLSFLAAAGTMGLVIATPPAVAGDVIVHIGVGAPAPQPVVYQYVYYPEAEVYYVPETRVYWWSNGGTWVSGPAVPSGIVLGASTTLRVDASEPWHHHEVIVQKYPGRHHHRRLGGRDRD